MVASAPRSRTRPSLPASTLILLVRHGTTPTTGRVLPGRARGLHLADSGRAQAEAVAARIAEWAAPPGPDPAPGGASPAPRTRGRRPEPTGPRIAAVYASPLERTRETAAPIAQALGLKVTAERGLLECDFGEWTGKELKDLFKLPEWTTVQRFPSGFRFPGGESFAGMQARMVDTLGALCARHRGEAVVCVSHADPIKAAVADAMGTALDLFQRIVISPCSVTAINVGATGPTVLAVNSTGTLKELRPS
jgi:broad specificity phosphatase PhoE